MNLQLFILFAAKPTSPLISLDNAFWISVLVIFLVTIISAFIRRRQRDRCVKLFDDFHSTFLHSKADPIWGDLCVTSEGIEVLFDAEYTTRRGLSKTSALVYVDELNECIALTRPIAGLSDEERIAREQQLKRSINPNLIRRSMRWIRNAINTISDAISRSFHSAQDEMSVCADKWQTVCPHLITPPFGAGKRGQSFRQGVSRE